MKILQVAGICGGGLGRHIRGLCDGLLLQGHRVIVAYMPHHIDKAFQQFALNRQNEIRFVPLNIRREISPASDLRATMQLARLIKWEGAFDVIHGHSAKGGAIARVVGRWFGIPTVYTPHGLIMTSPEISRLQTATYTLIEQILGHWATSRIIAVSEDECELFVKLNLVPSSRVTLIENGVPNEDIEYFSREAACLDIDHKPLTFGSTMRFDAQKAPGHLVEAFVRLCAALPQVPMRLIIAGDGELFGNITKQIMASGMGEKITLLGWRPDSRVVLRNFDIFVVSSLYEAGLSYSTMEAMAAKLPIVSTNVFGTKGTLSRVPGNILVPAGDPGALSQGMKRMATVANYEALRQTLRSIGQSNHNYVLAHFRQSETIRRTIELYQALCYSKDHNG